MCRSCRRCFSCDDGGLQIRHRRVVVRPRLCSLADRPREESKQAIEMVEEVAPGGTIVDVASLLRATHRYSKVEVGGIRLVVFLLIVEVLPWLLVVELDELRQV